MIVLLPINHYAAINTILFIYWSCYQSRFLDSVELKFSQSCLTLLWSHGILQGRILEWVAFPFFRGSSQHRDRTQVSRIAGGFFTSWATREAQEHWSGSLETEKRSDKRFKQGFTGTCAAALLSHKKEQNWVILKTWLEWESVIQSEVSQKEKHCILMHICRI